MKIDNIQAIQNVLNQQLPQEQLRQGDFVTSEVVKSEGDTAVLRTSHGTLLSANLVGHLNLLPGDQVETVVVEASPGRFVLRVLDIIRAEPTEVQASRPEAPAQFFQPQTLHSALSILKMNASLPPKTAEFMARNGIPATPENISTLGQLAGEGPRVAQTLTRMIADPVLMTAVPERIIDVGIVAIPTDVSIEAEQGRYDSFGAPPKDTSTQPQADIPAGQTGTSSTAAPLPQNAPPQNTSPQNAPANIQDMPAASPETSSPVMSMPADAANPAVPDAAAQGSEPNTPPGVSEQASALPRPDAAVPEGTSAFRLGRLSVSEDGKTYRPAVPYFIPSPGKEGTGEREKPAALLSRLISMFADLKDKENLPVRLRNAVHELPAQLKELKNSLMNTDSIDRNTWGQQAEMLDRQQNMMADIKRFDCYHIPLTTAQGDPATAELYVYKQRRRKKEQAPDTYSVLVALDTQHLGRVETLIRAQGQSVSLEFRLEQETFAGEFEESAKGLAPAIEQAGYRLGDVSVRPLAAKTTVISAEDVLTEGRRTADTGGMDIRI